MMLAKKAWGATLLMASLLVGLKYLFDLFEKRRRPKG